MSCCKPLVLTRVLTIVGLTLFVSSSFTMAGDPERLTTDGVFKRDPRFLADGRELTYCYDESPALIRMMRMDLRERQPQPMFEDSGNKHQIEPAFSADGRYVAFNECTGNLSAQLVIRDTRENKDAYITHAGRSGTRSPTFSPDGRLVVYAFAETGPQQLWSVTPLGTDKKQLTQCQGISNWPSFTPDGETLVFANSRENNYEIYSMRVDGSSEQRLTTNGSMDIRPTVSPDGSRIAFSSTRDGNHDVYVMGVDGRNVQRITDHTERDDYPAWHPSSEQLVIVSERAGQYDLYLVDVPSAKP